MEDSDRDVCSVCYNDLRDARVLPCWHKACFTCILEMSGASQSRALSCRVCRSTLEFNTVHSLPLPLKCALCKNLVRNPRKFPCCIRLCCLDCILKKGDDGTVSCVNNCPPGGLYTAVRLPVARLCAICFMLHTEAKRNCEHFLCRRCQETTGESNRNCRVCESATNPAPMPVNPFTGTDDRKDPISILSFPLLKYEAAMGLDQPRQHHQELRDPIQGDRGVIQQLDTNNLCKLVCFWTTLVAMLMIHGFCITTWTGCLLFLFMFNLNLEFVLIAVSVVDIVMFFVSFYYFYHAVNVFILLAIAQTLLTLMHSEAASAFLIITTPFVLLYYEPIFGHRLVLDMLVGWMLRKLNTV